MLDVQHLFIERRAFGSAVLSEVLEKFPDAEQHEVDSHWRIPELHQNEELLKKWAMVKRKYLVVGHKKKFTFKANGRSTDFIGPSVANGCAMACTYCYVARRKGYANPITIFANRDEMIAETLKHLAQLGPKQPNQCHETLWTYDIGCNNDISIDSTVCDTPRELMEIFKGTRALASFATKYVNRDMLNYDPAGNTRIRFSLMPEDLRKIVDVGTSSTTAKIEAINDFVDAGYEVHINFSPIIFVEDTRSDWSTMLDELNDKLSDAAKAQMACEIIMLTHNEQLHKLNERWHPKAEKLLWRPDIQEQKTSLNGAGNLRYDYRFKAQVLDMFKNMLAEKCPWIRIRYAF